jgi:hypothetical protein
MLSRSRKSQAGCLSASLNNHLLSTHPILRRVLDQLLGCLTWSLIVLFDHAVGLIHNGIACTKLRGCLKSGDLGDRRS